jgi:hypothetical protein
MNLTPPWPPTLSTLNQRPFLNGFLSFTAARQFNPSFIEVAVRPFKARTDLNILVCLRYSPGSRKAVAPAAKHYFMFAGKPRYVYARHIQRRVDGLLFTVTGVEEKNVTGSKGVAPDPSAGSHAWFNRRTLYHNARQSSAGGEGIC